MRKYIAEFIGTFFLVTGTIFAGAVGASLVLMGMIYAGGHISGAHYNPAVTIAMYIRKKITAAEMPGYFIAQFVGAAVAALLIYYVFEKQHTLVNCDGLPDGVLKSALAEIIGTFALAYVVLNVATAKGTAGNGFFGLAIAGTVLAMAWSVGAYSGGVFNPAVGLGLSIYKNICWSNLWMFFVAPIIGAVIAAYVFKTLDKDEEEMESIPEQPVIKIEDNSQHSA